MSSVRDVLLIIIDRLGECTEGEALGPVLGDEDGEADIDAVHKN